SAELRNRSKWLAPASSSSGAAVSSLRMRLVLFDIDGTLLRTQGVGAAAMERAGRRLLGPSFTLDGIDFGGALDPWIFRQAAERLGHDDPNQHHPAFRDAYLVELARGLD